MTFSYRELDIIELEAEAMFNEIMAEFEAELLGRRADYMNADLDLEDLLEVENAQEVESIEALQLPDL